MRRSRVPRPAAPSACPYGSASVAALGAGGALVGFDFPLVPLAATLDTLLPFASGRRSRDAQPRGGDRAGARRDSRALARDRSAPIPRSATGQPHGRMRPSPEQLAAEARGWIASGARIVGGCCGTTPEHIRALAAVRDAATPAARSG